MADTKQSQLTELFLQAGHAHHQAFLDTDGDDPEWALWYANYLKESLPRLLGVEMNQGRMVYELVRMADEAGASDKHWSELYAEDLIRKYG